MKMNPYITAAVHAWTSLRKLTRWSIAWVAVTAFLVLMLRAWDPVPVESLRLKGFDLLLASETPVASEEIVLLDLGERSMERLGQWPWDRRELAFVVSRLRELGAAVVVMPIIMSERDRLGGDDALAKELVKGRTVIAQAPTNQNKKPDAVRRGVAVIGGDPYTYLYTWPGAVAPRPELATAASGVGTAAVAPEVDGVVRRMPLVVNVAKEYYPNVTLETLRVFTGEKSYQMKVGDVGVEKVRVAGQPIIDTDANARVWLRWNKDFQRFEATDMAKKDISVKGKIVVVGLTAEGLGGIIATPRGERWAHDLQAQSIQTMLDGTTPSRPWWATPVEVVSIILITAVVMTLMTRLPIWGMAVLLFGTVGAVILGGLQAWQHGSYLLDIYFVTFAAIIIYGHGLFVRFAKEFLQKQQIKKQFGTYLSPALVAKLQKNPEMLQLGGDERELSIMFTDVRGFTTISEHYGKDVQGLTKIMNRYMTAMTAKIIENNGTLDKYIGDAQMAFWNAPVDEPQHAHQAVRTALAMMESLDEFNREIEAEGVPPFGMGLGINTGVVVVGNMGSSQRFDYTCLGDHVNLASRLEGQSKGYGVRIILGQRTAELVRDEFSVVELDTIAVKGKTVGVKVYTIGNTVNYQHDQFLEAYYRGNWTRAKKIAEQLIVNPAVDIKDYYSKMIDRIDEGLPPNWDGVYHATSK